VSPETAQHFKYASGGSAVGGVLYGTVGAMEMVLWLGGHTFMGLGGDPFTVFSLLLIAAMFLYTPFRADNDGYRAMSFLLSALLTATIIGVMCVLIAAAEIVDAALLGEKYAVSNDLLLPTILSLVVSPLWLFFKNNNHKKKWEEMGEV